VPSSKSRGHFRKKPKKIVTVPAFGRKETMSKPKDDDIYAPPPPADPAPVPAPAPAPDSEAEPLPAGPHEHRHEPPEDEPKE
jgi:hypothetical protein